MTNSDPAFDKMREQLHRQMLSSVSHDLKTPLATMIGSLEIFQRMYDRLSEDKRRSLVASALVEAYRLDSFISNILDMARLETGAVKPQRAMFDLGSIIHDEILRLGPKKQKGRFYPGESLQHVSVNNDPALVGRVIGILLDNTLKHAGPTPQIWIEAQTQNDHVLVSVRDDGPGVENGKEEEIFSKYTRLSRSDKQNAGTGLGLSIARAIADVIGGKLTVEPQCAEGAVFQLALPLH